MSDELENAFELIEQTSAYKSSLLARLAVSEAKEELASLRARPQEPGDVISRTVQCCACNKQLGAQNELSFVLTERGYEDSYYDFCNFKCLMDYCTEHDLNYRSHGSQGRDKWVKTGTQHIPHEHQGESWNGCSVCGWVEGHGLHAVDPKEKKDAQKRAQRRCKEEVASGKRVAAPSGPLSDPEATFKAEAMTMDRETCECCGSRREDITEGVCQQCLDDHGQDDLRSCPFNDPDLPNRPESDPWRGELYRDDPEKRWPHGGARAGSRARKTESRGPLSDPEKENSNEI